MKLYETWENMQELCQTDAQQSELWNQYYTQETEAYKRILEKKTFELSGTAKELAETLGMEPVIFAPFCDGINTSLEQELDVKEIEEESSVSMKILPEKLYYNMLSAKAKWLYGLKEWDGVLSEETRTEITRTWRSDHMAVSKKTVGRNDPCPCGSGKKYKVCCGR